MIDNDEYRKVYMDNLDECSMMLKYICTDKVHKKRLKDNKKIIKEYNDRVHEYGLEGLSDDERL